MLQSGKKQTWEMACHDYSTLPRLRYALFDALHTYLGNQMSKCKHPIDWKEILGNEQMLIDV